MPAAKKNYQAVIFDLDDTLLDWSGQPAPFFEIERPHVENIYGYLQEEKHQLPAFDEFNDRYKRVIIDSWQEAKKTWAGVYFGDVLNRLFTELELENQRIDLTAVMRAYDLQPYPGVTLYQDTIPVLDSVQQAGLKIGLITNSMMPMWMRDAELRAFEILDYFDARITSGDTGHMKPHPAIYQRGLALLDVTPEEAVFVGDRPANDIAGANEVGMTSVLLRPPHLERELNDVHPDHIISNLSELLSILAP